MKRYILDLRKAPSSPDRIISAANGFSSLDVSSDTSPSEKTVFARANSPWKLAILRKSSILKLKQKGFTSVELLIACVIFPLIVVGISNGYDAVRRSYTIAKQLNEMYAVLSACPEIDRALVYDSITSISNCYPNNSFTIEGGGAGTVTYTPSLTVTGTGSLPDGDPLKTVPDSKIIDITVPYVKGSAPPLGLRLLITRNGIAQQ